jgi:hypothetical protein
MNPGDNESDTNSGRTSNLIALRNKVRNALEKINMIEATLSELEDDIEIEIKHNKKEEKTEVDNNYKNKKQKIKSYQNPDGHLCGSCGHNFGNYQHCDRCGWNMGYWST